MALSRKDIEIQIGAKVDVEGAIRQVRQLTSRLVQEASTFTTKTGKSSVLDVTSPMMSLKQYQQFAAQAMPKIIEINRQGEAKIVEIRRMAAKQTQQLHANSFKHFQSFMAQKNKANKDAAKEEQNIEKQKLKFMNEQFKHFQNLMGMKAKIKRQELVEERKLQSERERQQRAEQKRLEQQQKQGGFINQFLQYRGMLGLGGSGFAGLLGAGVGVLSGSVGGAGAVGGLLGGPGMALGAAALTGALMAAQRVLSSIFNITGSIVGLFQHWVMAGVQLSAILETTQLAVTGSLTAFTNWGDSGLNQFEKWENAAARASVFMKDLKKDQFETFASFSHIARTAEQVLPPTKIAGFSDKEAQDFIIAGIQSAQVLGIPDWQLGQELRAVIEGVKPRPDQDRLAHQIFSGLGDDTKKFTDELKEADKFVEFVFEKLQPLQRAAKESMETFTGQVSLIKKGLEFAFSEGGIQFFEDLKSGLKDINSLIYVIDESGKRAINPAFIQHLNDLWESVQKLYTPLAKLFNALFVWNDEIDEKNPFKGLADVIRIAGEELERYIDKLGNFFNKYANLFDPVQTVGNRLAPLSFSQIKKEPNDFIFGRAFLNLQQQANGNQFVGGGGDLPFSDTDRDDSQKRKEQIKTFTSELEKQEHTLKKLELALYAAGDATKYMQDKAKFDTALLDNAREFKETVAQYQELVEKKEITQAHANELIGLAAAMKKVKDETAEANREFTKMLNSPILQIVNPNINKLGANIAWARGEGITSHITGREDETRTAASQGVLAQIFSEESHQRTLETYRSVFEKGAKTLSDGIVDALMEGGKNFGSMVRSVFSNFMATQLDRLFTAGMNKYIGFNPEDYKFDDKIGLWVNKRDPRDTITPDGMIDAEKRTDKLNSIVNVGMSAVSGYYGGLSNQKGATTNAVLSTGISSGAMAALSTNPYGWVIAAIATIVAGISSAIGKAQAREEYKYGIPTINRSGEAGFIQSRNIQETEQKMIVAEVQDTFDTFWNGYVALASKFPDFILPKLNGVFGKFQSEASKFYMKHLDEFLKRTLPDEIAATFMEGLKSSFESVGMAGERFEQIWKRLSNLDPAKQLELLGVLVDAFLQMNEAFAYFENVRGGSLWNLTRSTREQMQGARDIIAQGPAYQFKEAQINILEIANILDDMTGEAQIRKAHELASAMTGYVDMHKQFIAELTNMLDGLMKSFQQNIDDILLNRLRKEDGTPDYEAQMEMLKRRADSILFKTPYINDPQELLRMGEEYQSIVNTILQMAGEIGDLDTIKAYEDWALRALEIGKLTFESAFTRLGNTINMLDKVFLEKVQPVWDRFSNVIDQGVTDVGEFIGGIDEGREAIIQLAIATDNATFELNNFAAALGSVDGFSDLVASRR